MSKAITPAQPASQETEIDYLSWFDISQQPKPMQETQPVLQLSEIKLILVEIAGKLIDMKLESDSDKSAARTKIRTTFNERYPDIDIARPKLVGLINEVLEENHAAKQQQPDSFTPIKYCKWIAVRKDDSKNIHEIGWDKIDNYEFRNGFIEILDNPEYVHLYFDYDSIKTIDEFNDVSEWLVTLKPTFGDFTGGGYTNNKDVAETTGLKYIEGEKHFISMHVLFCQTRIAYKP